MQNHLIESCIHYFERKAFQTLKHIQTKICHLYERDKYFSNECRENTNLLY